MKPARKHLPVVQPDRVYEENFAVRKQVADEAARELAAAIEACGPDAEAYCRWTQHDKLGIEPPRYFYGCRRDDGRGWQPEPPENNERVMQDVVTFVTASGIKYESHSLTINGLTLYPYRWSTYFQALTEYKPRTPEQMKAAAEQRRAKAIAEAEAEQRELDEKRREAAHRQPSLFGDEP